MNLFFNTGLTENFMKINNNFSLPLIIFLVFNVLIFGSDKKVKIKKASVDYSQSPLSIKDSTYFFSENWENGFNSWVTKDEADIGTMWQLTSWNAYEGSGQSWHLADTSLGTNGGYNNGWYQVLDTDPITLSGSGLELTFFHRYSVEPPPSSSESGYNGWDGMNVRITTDNGTTWNVLANPNLAYSDTSLYSFGFVQNEGTGIPGWTGTLDAWTQVTFDLSAYSGKTVMIRFAFASDLEYSTPENASLFGWEIDNIKVTNSSSTLFSNDGTLTGLTPKNNATLGGNLWRIASIDTIDNSSYASCNTDSNTYLPNMKNSLTSKYISLPKFATDILFDFELRGTFSDLNFYPNIDFFGVYIQVEGESKRRFISNITNDLNVDNFIYSDAPSTWSSFVSSYNFGQIKLDSLKDKKFRVIIEFVSDGDSPVGSGLQIDNLVIYSPNIVSVKDGNSNSLPLSIKLEQNYPNPFNPSTIIKYSIPASLNPSNGGTLVQLKIYDILGNEIAALVNENKSAGNYEVKFDAGKYGLSSGIYFYQLRVSVPSGKAGNFVQTKKLILMK